ncbi:MAG: AAA family ATPase [Planctomycetota bacterium]
MKLTRLRIRRLPGIDRPYSLEDFSPGLNYVGGPNGCGKSSIIRAVRAVLWAEHRVDEGSEVDAWFDKHGDTWHGRLRGRECQWTKNGQEHSGPIVPPAEHAYCYTIESEDLRDLAADEGELASLILRQLAGGYDLAALASGVSVGARHGQSDRRKLQLALKELEQTRNHHRRLVDREQSLASLRDDLSSARAAREDLERLAAARELLQARAELERLELELEALPPDLSRLVGDEADRAERLVEERSRLDGELHQLGAAEAELRVRLDRLIVGDGVTDAALRLGLSRTDELRELKRRCDERSRELRTAEARLIAAAGIGPDQSPNEEELERWSTGPSPEEFRAVEEWIRRTDELRARAATRRAEIDLLPANDDDAPRWDDLSIAISLLRRWLRAPAPRDTQRPMMTAAGIAVACLGVLAAAWLPSNPQHLWVAPLVLAPLLPVALAYRREKRRGGRDTIVREFTKLGLTPPDAWTALAVEQRLDQFERTASDREPRERRTRLEVELEAIRAEEAELEAQRTAFAHALGGDPSEGDLPLWVIGNREIERAEAARTWVTIERELLQLDARRREQADELLAEWGTEVEADASFDSTRWRHELETLHARLRQRRETRRELDGLESRRASVERELARNHDAREKWTQETGLEVHDRRELLHRLEALPRFRERTRDHERLGWRLEELLRSLTERPELAKLDRRELEALAERRRAEADRYESIVARVSEIEREIREARAGNALEEALATVDTARSRLATERDRALDAAAAAFLIDDVVRDHRERSQPRLLQRAAELFAAFTRDRFRLRVGGQLPSESSTSASRGTFEAIDVATHDVLPLSALSSGTRTQLLLAVRLAFALESERGTSLPFFLDEVLSHSDPERSRSVADCLRHVVENEGGQVFYLSCQPEEETLFRRAFGAEDKNAEPESAITVFDLAGIRGVAAAEPEPRVLTTIENERPDPNLPPAAYARALRVPRFDLRKGIDAQHVFHLVSPDAERVDRLLQHGIETVGQLRSFLTSPRVDAFFDEAERGQLEAVLRIGTEFARAWSVGRGRPIERRVLADAGVKGRYLEMLAELADELGGDAEALLRSLDERSDPRTKGFRKQEDLQSFLAEHGYHDRRPVPEPGAVRIEALERLASLVENQRVPVEEVSTRLSHLQSLADGDSGPRGSRSRRRKRERNRS